MGFQPFPNGWFTTSLGHCFTGIDTGIDTRIYWNIFIFQGYWNNIPSYIYIWMMWDQWILEQPSTMAGKSPELWTNMKHSWWSHSHRFPPWGRLPPMRGAPRMKSSHQPQNNPPTAAMSFFSRVTQGWRRSQLFFRRDFRGWIKHLTLAAPKDQQVLSPMFADRTSNFGWFY